MSGLFNDVMTVYNHYKDNGVDKWRRTVVAGVQWSHNKTQTSVSGGVQTESRVESITIDFNRRSWPDNMYVLPNAYTGKAGTWTLNAKSGMDVLVLGGTTQEISESYPIEKLREDYQYVGTVTSVSDNRNRPFLKSIKVVVQ